MLSAYLQQCCLLIVPDEQSITASFSNIHTATAGLAIHKKVFTGSTRTFETWNKNYYTAQLFANSNLRELWLKAFEAAFEEGFRKVILLTTAPKGLTQDHLQEAFLSLRILEVCMGPGKDGNLYLAGMNTFNPEILINSILDEKPTWKAFQRAVGAQKAAMYKLPVF
jgi:glycosyltransferase A (GT-A) superfamily protein (DUF2064 family)